MPFSHFIKTYAIFKCRHVTICHRSCKCFYMLLVFQGLNLVLMSRSEYMMLNITLALMITAGLFATSTAPKVTGSGTFHDKRSFCSPICLESWLVTCRTCKTKVNFILRGCKIATINKLLLIATITKFLITFELLIVQKWASTCWKAVTCSIRWVILHDHVFCVWLWAFIC